jgi:hypothetical protein
LTITNFGEQGWSFLRVDSSYKFANGRWTASEEAITLNQMAAKELESGDDGFLKERREGLESINNDIAAAAFATDMAELESDDAIKDLIKVAEEERVRGQEYINFVRGLRIITYLVKFCQKDPGGLSFSMNNVRGYQLMFFKGHIDSKARNRRNRMFGAIGGPHELSHHQVVSILLGVTAAEPYLCTKISLIKLCAA